jgi:hypothetical protein
MIILLIRALANISADCFYEIHHLFNNLSANFPYIYVWGDRFVSGKSE